jgi:glycerophosphoryl diester phosphodiesterase
MRFLVLFLGFGLFLPFLPSSSLWTALVTVVSAPKERDRHRFYVLKGLSGQLIGHNGGGDTYPPDSLPSFLAAVELHGCNAVELDLLATFDGQLAVFHDADASLVTNRTLENNCSTTKVAEIAMKDLRRTTNAAFGLCDDGKGYHVKPAPGVCSPGWNNDDRWHVRELKEMVRDLDRELLKVKGKSQKSLGTLPYLTLELKPFASRAVTPLVEAFLSTETDQQQPGLCRRAAVMAFEPHILTQFRHELDHEVQSRFENGDRLLSCDPPLILVVTHELVTGLCRMGNAVPPQLCHALHAMGLVRAVDAALFSLAANVVPHVFGLDGIHVNVEALMRDQAAVDLDLIREWKARGLAVHAWGPISQSTGRVLREAGVAIAPNILPLEK